VFSYVEVADGRVWMRPEGVVCFAGDLSHQEQKVVWATHYAPAADLFSRNAPGTAWKSKPTWYIVANNDRTVQPDLQRFLAKRMGATTHAVDSSHVPMLSHPGFGHRRYPCRRKSRSRIIRHSVRRVSAISPRAKPNAQCS
jgi:pimeloyl-ACP methyl ester carboxylesterase